MLPLIAITQGDPAGIGPELCLKTAVDPRVLEACRPVIIGDRIVLEQCAEKLGLPMPGVVLGVNDDWSLLDRLEGAALIDCDAFGGAVEPGRPTAEAGMVSYRYLLLAIDAAMSGLIDAITTAPITKATLHMAGIDEPGHTEILAKRTGAENYAMMLYSETIAVSLVTIHQSIASVSQSLSVPAIARVIDLAGLTLKKIRGRAPKLAVVGLNPHAGEGGLFGDEEESVIRPAIEQARAAGWNVEGPLVPDAAFTASALGRYDGHVVMYHDQGLIPFKMLSFAEGVNITMGLPIVRTSPDHGTAYDIAWSGKADTSSMVAAIRLAAKMSSEG
ncbi:4-hydroxythreonine-4-phosphate dehydrogenase PdxA [bacterium]|nr:4-hydroxythreonine-4-phosphate dehydrogenase PdxA [bacterium]